MYDDFNEEKHILFFERYKTQSRLDEQLAPLQFGHERQQTLLAFQRKAKLLLLEIVSTPFPFAAPNFHYPDAVVPFFFLINKWKSADFLAF